MILQPSELSIGDYHAACPDFLSKTTIKAFANMGPRLWYETYVAKTIDPPVPGGVEEGLALDALMTSGEEALNAGFCHRPAGLDLRTKEGKAWKEEAGDKIILSHNDWLILHEVAAAMRAHPSWTHVEQCAAQQTIRRHSNNLNIGFQSRPDWLNTKDGLIYDCKKVRSLDAIQKQSVECGYILQMTLARWCLAGMGIAIKNCYLVCAEWERWGRVRVYEVKTEDMDRAMDGMIKIAQDISDRLDEDNWDDKPPMSQPLDLSSWQSERLDGKIA